MSDTIAAIATGSVRSAVGIIRLSGDDALSIAGKVFKARNGKNTAEFEAGKLIYGGAYSAGGELLDMCLCTVSRAPKSYTGEDTAEIHCHGSPVVLASVLSELFAAGARQALPGEFTKRAFLNGKLDLTGAEAVIDLIDAETAEAAKNAAGQISGAVLKKTEAVYSKLLDAVSHFHAVVDWPDEDIEEFEIGGYLEVFERCERELSALLNTFNRGRLLKDGVKCAIVGRPNVGKSSLLNALLGYERAIVTDIAGTTRDTVEEKCVLGGVLLRLIDTAGIRETEDTVEKIGVERSLSAVESAELILAVVDGSQELGAEDMAVLRSAQTSGKPWIFVVNKIDITKNARSVGIVGTNPPKTVTVSAATGAGIEELSAVISDMFKGEPVPQGEILTNARQAGEVSRALESLKQARAALLSGMTADAVLTETEDALGALGALSGKTLRQDVTDRIFERFCVGK